MSGWQLLSLVTRVVTFPEYSEMSLSEKREMGPSHPLEKVLTFAQVWRKRRGLKLGEQRDLGWARRQVGAVLGLGC